MKVRIKRISPSSLALIFGSAYLILGIIGIFISAIGFFFLRHQFYFNSGFLTYSGDSWPRGYLLLYMLACPFINFLIGLIIGFIAAWSYNLITLFTKGLLIETENVNNPFED